MTFKDFYISKLFKNDEKRDPSMTEIRVLDTYWSDHCRHTTFSTELKNVAFDDGYYCAPMKETYEDYLNTHKNLYAGRSDKFVCLMDLALMAMKRLKKEGKLQDQEESDEINACSIVVPIKVDGVEEEWLINLKMRRTTIRQKLSLSAVRLPVWAERSVIPFPDVLMFTRLCVLPERRILQSL